MMGAPEIPLVLQPLVMPIRYTSAGKVPSEEKTKKLQRSLEPVLFDRYS